MRPVSNFVETPDVLRVRRFTTVLAGKYWESNLTVSSSLLPKPFNVIQFELRG
jgi:hypothetical protein